MVCSLVVYDHITDRKVLGGVGPASSVGTSLARWTWRSAEMHIRKSAFTTTSSTTTTTPDFIEDTIRYCCCCSTTKLMVARMKKHVTHTRYSNSSKSQYDWKKSGKLMALPSLLPGHEPKVWAKSVLSKTSVKEPKKVVDRAEKTKTWLVTWWWSCCCGFFLCLSFTFCSTLAASPQKVVSEKKVVKDKKKVRLLVYETLF